MITQKFRYFTRVLHMALNPECKSLDSLQEQEAVKRRQSGTGVSLTHGAASRDKSSVPELVDIDDIVIGHLRHVQHIKLFRIPPPRELAAIDNHSADTSAAPSNELRHGMYDHIGAVLNRP